MNFQELHEQNTPLIICNVWDVASAKIAEKSGFKTIGTSSAAIASCLGYEDGEDMNFDELCYIVNRIQKNSTLPLTVDLESGYSNNCHEVVNHIKRLATLGVVGVNIEDSSVDGERCINEAEKFASFIATIKHNLIQEKLDIFLNVRTDTFLLGLPDALTETEKRLKLYTEAGANGFFIPCIEKESDINNIAKKSSIPINVMCMPSLPNFERLKSLGVKRISMGNFIYSNLLDNLESRLISIRSDQSFNSLFKQ